MTRPISAMRAGPEAQLAPGLGTRRGVGYELDYLPGLVGAGDVREEVLRLSLECPGLDVGPDRDGALACQGSQVLRRDVVDGHRPGARSVGGHTQKLHRLGQRLARAKWVRLVQEVVGYDAGGAMLHGKGGGMAEAAGPGPCPGSAPPCRARPAPGSPRRAPPCQRLPVPGPFRLQEWMASTREGKTAHLRRTPGACPWASLLSARRWQAPTPAAW